MKDIVGEDTEEIKGFKCGNFLVMVQTIVLTKEFFPLDGKEHKLQKIYGEPMDEEVQGANKDSTKLSLRRLEKDEVIVVGTVVYPLKMEKGIMQKNTPMEECCEAKDVALKVDDKLRCHEE